MIASLFEKAETTRLELDSDADLMDYAAHSVEQSNRVCGQTNTINIVEAYGNLNLELLIRIRIPNVDPTDWYLSILALPVASLKPHSIGFVDHVLGAEEGNQESFVLARVAELVQGPKGYIPSLVRLKRSHQGKDFWRDVFGSFSSTRFDFGGVIPERKVSVFPGIPACTSHGKAKVIERSAQVLESVGCVQRDWCWQRMLEHDAMQLLARIETIRLDAISVRLGVKEGLGAALDLSDLRLGVLDQ